MMTNLKKKPWLTGGRLLALLVLAAFIIRVLAVLLRPMIQLDETAYVRMAHNVLSGHGLLDITGLTAVHFSPLLPLYIAGLFEIVRNYVLAAYIIVTVFGSLLLIPTYLLGKELSGRRVGLMAAALMAVTPIFVDYSSRIYTESVYIFFLGMTLVFGLYLLRGRGLRYAPVAGVSLGMAYLANPSAMFYLVALAALIVIAGFVRARGANAVPGARGQAGRALVIFVAVFMIFATPYIFFLHSQLGVWTYSGKLPGNTYSAIHNLRATTVDWEKDLLSLTDDNRDVKLLHVENDGDPASTFLKHPVQGIKILAKQSYIFYSEVIPQVIPLWLLPLMGLGLFASGWTRRRAAGIGYLLLMMAPALLILSMYAHSRFFMPFVPLAMIWVADGWARLERWGGETATLMLAESRRQRLERWAPWLIGAAVLLPLLAFSASTVLKQSYPVGYKEAGQNIKQTAGEGNRIMSREYSAAYYSGGTAVLLPYAEYDRTVDYARKNGIDFLVIRRQEITDWRPLLSRLTEGDAAHPEWKLVGDVRPGTDQETLIFQLQPAVGA